MPQCRSSAEEEEAGQQGVWLTIQNAQNNTPVDWLPEAKFSNWLQNLKIISVTLVSWLLLQSCKTLTSFRALYLKVSGAKTQAAPEKHRAASVKTQGMRKYLGVLSQHLSKAGSEQVTRPIQVSFFN